MLESESTTTTNIIYTGPFEKFVVRGEGVSDNRDLYNIEDGLRKSGVAISLEEILRSLGMKFGGVLEVFEGGSGTGRVLDDIKKLAVSLGLNIRTTGSSLDPSHAESAQYHQLDELIVGSVQKHFELGRFIRKYHFVIDYCGAISYDRGGRELIPIYSQLLKPDGMALLLETSLDLDSYGGPKRIEKHLEESQETIRRFGANGLKVILAKKCFALVEKT